MGFVKLDSGLLTSTLWAHREEREVFITALLMAEPHEVLESTPQLEVGSLHETGFQVPVGWYGFVAAAGPGIIRQALVGHVEGMAALKALGDPDPESRSKAFEGRRMVRVDGGYIILNYIKYRDRDYTAAARAKRYRDRIKDEPSHRDAVTSHRNVTQAEEEVEEEKDVHPTGVAPAAPLPLTPRKSKPDLEPIRLQVLEHWRLVAVPAGLPGVLGVSDKLRKAMDARLKNPAWLGLFQEAVTFAARHPAAAWMRGEKGRDWKVSLEWLLKPDKVEETVAKARASPGRAGGIAADVSMQAQVQQLPVRKLARTGAP